jgi:hypothetical protein
MFDRGFRALGKATFVFIIILVSSLAGIALHELFVTIVYGNKGDELRYSRELQVSTFYSDYISGTAHIIGPNSHRGPIKTEWRQYDDGYKIEINKFGFFTDWPLDEYPEKEKNEFRIILIGGSGAQGWGGQTNGDMLYKQLEKQTNALVKERGIKVHVINMAMAGSRVITNAEMLHGYGKHLKADMILAYAGVNDTSGLLGGGVLYETRQTGAFPVNMEPAIINQLVSLFPATMLKYGVAEKIKGWLGIRSSIRGMPLFYRHKLGNLMKEDPKRFLFDYATPATVKAFKDIKRDFCGVPIMVVRQMWHPPDWVHFFFGFHWKIKMEDGSSPYDVWWTKIQDGLPGYVNGEWYFFDAQKDVWGHLANTASIEINKDTWSTDFSKDRPFTFKWTDGKTYNATMKAFAAHLDNLGHYIVSDWLAPKVADIVSRNYAASRGDVCDSNFVVAPSSAR